jgi:hypothetical protein
MIHLLSSSWRRAAPVIAGGILAAAVTFAVGPSAMADGPQTASPGTVQAGLGVKPVRAEIVILVDISMSMSSGYNDLYQGILDELPGALNALAKQEPQDRVAIIEFAMTARQIYDGPAAGNAVNRLPGGADEVGSNIGAAFQQAITTFKRDVPAQGIQAGGVVLLSDGELYAPGDGDYGSYDGPGWDQLPGELANLPVRVSGYGLQLPTDKTFDDQLPTALGKAFGTPPRVAKDTADLTSRLELLGQGLLDRQVAAAAEPDHGKGVRVSWSGLPGRGGRGPLNLTSAGQLDAEVTLTAATRRVPLYLTDLSVRSAGFSDAISGTVPASDRVLALSPGQSVTVPVHLSWRPRPSGISFNGNPQLAHGQLVLTGHVSSTYTQAIRHGFNDLAFSTGGLTGGVTALAATVPVFWNVLLLLVILAAILAILGLITFVRLRLRLGGTFTLTSVDDFSSVIPLSRWRWRRSVSTDDVIGIPGQMSVRGHLFGKEMKIRLRLKNRPVSELELAPGGRTMIAGIDIVHETGPERSRIGSRAGSSGGN